jgi:hypothetical protein
MSSLPDTWPARSVWEGSNVKEEAIAIVITPETVIPVYSEAESMLYCGTRITKSQWEILRKLQVVAIFAER